MTKRDSSNTSHIYPCYLQTTPLIVHYGISERAILEMKISPARDYLSGFWAQDAADHGCFSGYEPDPLFM